MKPRSQQNCGNCVAFMREKNDIALGRPVQGTCRADSPRVFPVPVQMHGGQTMMAAQGFFPPTMSDGWCRKWDEREAVAADPLPLEEPATEASIALRKAMLS